jgi:predicted phosphodiesterase
MPRKLKSNFPFNFKNERKSYIADRYCFIDLGEILIFNFNSVHSHTNSEAAMESIITDDILEEIKYDLESNSKEYKYKIAFSHHHPIKHSNVGFKYKDSDFIEKGEKLLEILDLFDFQIFIHGHKHEPKLTCYNNIPVFASGSLSAIMNLNETGSKNNFHIIKLKPNDKKGTINSWEYTFGIGWSEAKTKIKHEIGFGNRNDIIEFSQKILRHFESEELERMNNEDFLLQFPDFKFYPPNEQEKLISELKKSFDIVQEYNTGHVKEIIKKN